MKPIEAILQNMEIYIKQHKNPVVACSFGKDSLVVLHLAWQVKKDIDVVFNNTLVEYPDTLAFKRKLTDEWNLNVVEIKPLNGWTFWKIVERYGFPLGQRQGSEATGKCCYYLKKAPMHKAMKEHGWDLVIDGMTIHESRQRYLNIKEPYRYNQGWRCYKYSPIWDWTPNDVWDYIERYDLPYNPYYDKTLWKSPNPLCKCLSVGLVNASTDRGIDEYKGQNKGGTEHPGYTKRGYRDRGFYRCLRVGCWACTIGIKYDPLRLTHLCKYYPKLHKLLLQRGLGKLLLEKGKNVEIYQNLGLDWIVENRPCYFDGVRL